MRSSTLLLSIACLLAAAATCGCASNQPSQGEPASNGPVAPVAAASRPDHAPRLDGERVAALAEVFTGGVTRGLLEADARLGPPAPRRPAITEDTLARVRADIDAVLARESLGATVTSALVYELESRQVVYERNADQLLKPASNTKLFTTAAALELLGPDHRIETDVYATGHLDPEAKTLHGDLVLVGQGDFTWSDRFYPSADFPLQQLAARIKAHGIEHVDGNLVAAGEFVYDGFHFGTLDPDAHRNAALKAFKQALLDHGISAGSRETRSAIEPPDGGERIATWRSHPLSVATVPINRISHNEFADGLLRHLGWVRRGEASYQAGAAEIVAWLDAIGIDSTGIALNDGSGLSHDNRVSARQLTALTDYMLSAPSGRAWRRTMSVAGEFGTYAGRMRGDQTRGRVFVKSGTLDGVITTSGFFVNQFDGRTYVLSLLMNETPGRKSPRLAQNAIVEAFSGDLLGFGARPASPTLLSVRSTGDGHTARVQWTPVDDAVGYWLWTSRDGHRWDRNRYTVAHGSQIVRDWPTDEKLYVRVTAIDERGAESDPGDTYAARVSDMPASLLIVDANDRWQGEPAEENTLAAGHDFVCDYASALGGVAFDSVANELVADGTVALGDYRAVMWAAGEQNAVSGGLSAAERLALTSYLDGGGRLMLSGSELTFELTQGASADAEGRTFCEEHLKASCVADDARSYLVEGAGGIFADVPTLGFLTPGGMEVDTPDVLEPLGGAQTCLRYVGRGDAAAAVQFAGPTYRLVQLGFPFESIDSAADRAQLMSAVLEFFAGSEVL